MVISMDHAGMDREKVSQLIDRYHSMDINFSSGRIFGSMCTSPHPLAIDVHSRFHEANLGNPGLYPGSAEMEKEVISMLGRLYGLPAANGHVLSGGTEANITTMYVAKKRSGKKEVLFPRSSHFSIIKAIKLLDMVPVPVDLDDDYRMDVGDLEKKISSDTAIVIGVAGTTELGAVDPIQEISDLIRGPHLHVDAAFGGFVLPFLKELDLLDSKIGSWDLSVPGVTSLSTDPHKMGWSTIPAGCLLFRESNILNSLAVESPYLTSPKAYTLAGTRDSGAVASSFAMMKYLGIEGYKELISGCMDNTNYLRNELEQLDLFPVVEPVMNIIAVSHRSPGKVQERMRGSGYYISKVIEPSALRFVIMPHVTKGSIDGMIPRLKKVLKEL